MVEDTPILSAAELYIKESSFYFSDISLTAILAGDHPCESVKVRHTLSLAKFDHNSQTMQDRR